MTAPVDGTGSAAGFVAIIGLASDKLGHIAVTEASSIRSITEAGAVSTIAALCTPQNSSSNIAYSGAAFDASSHLAFDGDGSLLVSVNRVAVVRLRLLWTSGRLEKMLVSDENVQ